MKRVNSAADIFAERFAFNGMVVVDVGCGIGDLVRWLASQGSSVTGVDKPQILAKADSHARIKDELYLPGSAEELPLGENSADLLIYAASFHHVPEFRMQDATSHCRRVLKPGGHVVFIEPVGRPGSYTEITWLIENEAEIQRKAYETIQRIPDLGFEMIAEDFYFIERSYDDYLNLVNIFVEDDARKPEILSSAKAITERLARNADIAFEDFRYQSIVRLNLFQKRA